VVKMKKTVLVALAACVAALALMLPMAGGAQAAERQFCSGVNLAPYGGGCGSGEWRLNSAYASSMNGSVCLRLLVGAYYDGTKCSGGANQGVYQNAGICNYGRAGMTNYNSFWIKAYGVLWTC
jgi:hypothetical protein